MTFPPPVANGGPGQSLDGPARPLQRIAAAADLAAWRLLRGGSDPRVFAFGVTAEERAYLEGFAHCLVKEYPEAIARYAQAVELRPQAAEWRYELARLLERQGRVSEAHEQAKLCARLDPQNGRYRTLLRQINHARLRQESP